MTAPGRPAPAPPWNRPQWAIVLAGGSGRRMGGVDKPSLLLDGVPMLARATAAVAPARTVVVGPRRALPEHLLQTTEDPPGGGPAAGVVAGLAALGFPAGAPAPIPPRAPERPGPAASPAGRSGFGLLPVDDPLVAVLAADLPGITPAVVDALAAAVHAGRLDGAVLVDPDGREQYLAGVWRATALARSAAARPSWHGRPVAELLGPLIGARIAADRFTAADLDTPGDLLEWGVVPPPISAMSTRGDDGVGDDGATGWTVPEEHDEEQPVTAEAGSATEFEQGGGRPVGPDASGRPGIDRPGPARDAALLERTVFEVKKVIVGQDRLVERMLVGLLARGHLLIEGVPGVAKTLAVETFARVVGGTFSRIQFTPDLVPSDLLGTRIYRAGREEFDTELGPVVANFVLTDEINRAPAKVQSALLEVMAERHVSIGGTTYPMPDPFLVMATQNPIENEGVYPLPEAQRDRFLFKLIVGYPEPDEEREIVYRMGVTPPVATQVLPITELARLQQVASNVFVHHALVDYVVRLVYATRTPAEHGLPDVAGWLSYGASPRASLGIIAAARALALVRGRDFVVPQDVLDVAPDVLRHRLVLSYDALADGIPVDDILTRLLRVIPLPQISPYLHNGVA